MHSEKAVTLLDRLTRKVEQALASTWEHAQPLAIRLEPPPHCDAEGRLVVGAAYLVQGRNGAWVEVHREPPVALADAEAVDDFLARGLSMLLMRHPAWPK